jgi:O-antigen/teichoic acid export membrane protein
MDEMKLKIINFLRKTEKYTKTDMVYLAKSNFWLNINKFLSIGNGFILSIAFANFITKEEYGLYTFVLAIIGLFTMAPTTGLGNGITREAAQGNHQIIFEGLRKIFPWSILSGIMIVILGIYYGFQDNFSLFICFILAGTAIPILISSSVAKSFLSSIGDFKTLASWNARRTPFMTLAIIFTLWLTKSATIVLIVYIAGNLLLGILLYRSVTKKYNLKDRHQNSGRFAGRFGFHTGLISLFNYFADEVDSLLLWKLLGAGPLALYTYAIAPVREIRGLIENQSAIALPRFAQRDFQTVKENLGHKIKQLYFVAVPIAIAYIILAPFIFSIFFPQYLESVIYTQIATVSILSAPRRLISTAISAHQKIKESYIMSLAPNIIKIISMIILIPIYGIFGAIIALIITEIIDYIILGILLKQSKNN